MKKSLEMSIPGNAESLDVRIGLVMGGFALATVVGPIDEIIRMLEKAKQQGYRYFVGTSEFYGQLWAPSKKIPFFRVGFAFAGKAFKTNDLKPILGAPAYAILLFKDMDDFSDEARRLIEENMGGDGGKDD